MAGYQGFRYSPDERYLLTRMQERPAYVAVAERKAALLRLKTRGFCTVHDAEDPKLAGVLIGVITPMGKLVDPLTRARDPYPFDPDPPRIA